MEEAKNEAIEPAAVPLTAQDPVQLVPEGPPDPAAFAAGVEAAREAATEVNEDATIGEESLPAIPVGAVPSSAPALEILVGNESEAAIDPIESVGDEVRGEVPTLRFIGESGPELDFVSPEQETASFDDVLVQLVDAALESASKSDEGEFTGHTVAQIFCRGDVEDPRVAFLLLLLAQDKPVTAELVLSAARAQGYEELVDQATIAREELARAGDVSVEQLVAASGTFAPMAEASPGALS